MRLITWNVLHRIHAQNWDEAAVLAAFPDESARLDAILRRIEGWMSGSQETCVALQEVSGDLLERLRARFPEAVHSFQYQELPRLRREGPSSLRDPSQHLVTVLPEARALVGEDFSDGGGYGFLAVQRGALRIVNTHVRFGLPGGPQILRLREVAGPGPAAVCGDFNRGEASALEDLGPGYEAASAHRSVDFERRLGIDHVFVRGLCGVPLALLAPGPESDHPPVAARLTPPGA
jgi:endonuclease/exonuclease/phosphatase family metal-dependent hydrolase